MDSGPVRTIARLFATVGTSDYLGESVSQASHMLQAAALAEAARVSPALIAAALLHDVGHFTGVVSGHDLVRGTDNQHGDAGADWLAQWFGPEVTEPVRLHVAAKRYLCAVEPGYLDTLSPASVRTLRIRGGPLGIRSDLDHHGDDHGAAAVVLVDPPPDGPPDQLAELVRVVNVVGGGAGQRLVQPRPHLAERGVVDARAARVDLRPGDQLAGGRVHHDDHGHEALLAQDPAVLERRLGHLAHGQAVDVDVAAGHLADHRGPPVHQVDHNAILGDHDVPIGHPAELGEPRVRPQVSPFAVHRHEVARPHQVQHVEQFAGRCVPGHVHHRVALVRDPRTPPGQLVDDPVDRRLVAGDQ